MKITIHRGIDQIGGCITEIATDRTSILIDLGQNLPNGEGVIHDELATRKAVENLTRGVDAIFYTHYHGDHIGLFHLVPDGVPQYMGGVAMIVTAQKHLRLSLLPQLREENERAVKKVAAMRSFEAKDRIVVGDITVTPYFVSHSACDAYMFLIEADGKHILHTGDFRGHGYLSKGTLPTIEKYILRDGAVDFLITEGTMLSRTGERVATEAELGRQIEDVMRRYKYVFAMCSSTDMERLATFAAANRNMRGRLLVCDEYQRDVLQIFTHTKGKRASLFRFDEAVPFDYTLGREMSERGFCMFVRASVGNKFVGWWNFLKQFIDPAQAVLIYSMWGEYVRRDDRHANRIYLKFFEQFQHREILHTSGHASPEFLAEVCRAVNPTLGIIPIHSEDSASYTNLPIGEDLQQKIVTASTTVDDVRIEIAPKV